MQNSSKKPPSGGPSKAPPPSSPTLPTDATRSSSRLRNTATPSSSIAKKVAKDTGLSDVSTGGDEAEMENILANILSHDSNDTPESLQSSLTLSAQIGQQLLHKTQDLEHQLREEQASKQALQNQIEELKKIVKSEHTLRVEAGLEVIRKEESLAALRRNVVQNGDIKSEAETLRSRIEHMDSTHSQLDKILQMTNRELKTVVGERHVLQLTVRELYDQLGNFMEINNSLKKSCQKQIQDYKNMISDMQIEKKQLSERLTEEIKKIQNLSSKDSATIDSLTSTIKAIMNQEQTSVFAHIQQQNVADMLALQSTVENVEAEKRELLDIISRQQESIKTMEEDVINLEARLSDKDRGALTRDMTAVKGLTSLKSSLSNADLILGDQEKDEHRPGFNEFDAASSDMLNFLESGKSHSANIEKEILSADDQLVKFSRKLGVLSQSTSESRSLLSSESEMNKGRFASSPSSHYVSIDNMGGSLNRPTSLKFETHASYLQAEEEAKRKLRLEAEFSNDPPMKRY
ncbi:hypothetical protein BDR26DRAFT_956918 [Obelidium mucronatum]|nr:hypothetical protein BDR26DRAFT_956918 [Obelidium mucronatum]